MSLGPLPQMADMQDRGRAYAQTLWNAWVARRCCNVERASDAPLIARFRLLRRVVDDDSHSTAVDRTRASFLVPSAESRRDRAMGRARSMTAAARGTSAKRAQIIRLVIDSIAEIAFPPRPEIGSTIAVAWGQRSDRTEVRAGTPAHALPARAIALTMTPELASERMANERLHP